MIRNLRAVAGLKPSQKVPVMLVSGKEVLQNTLKTSINDIAVLTKAKEVQILSPAQAKTNINGGLGVWSGMSSQYIPEGDDYWIADPEED